MKHAFLLFCTLLSTSVLAREWNSCPVDRPCDRPHDECCIEGVLQPIIKTNRLETNQLLVAQQATMCRDLIVKGTLKAHKIKGHAGPRGKRGRPGDPGDPGATGPTGATGPAGDPGDPGATGAAGPAGATGATGATGPTSPGVIVVNSNSMGKFDTPTPDREFSGVYSNGSSVIWTWALDIADDEQNPVTFTIMTPEDFDPTGPSKLILYLLVNQVDGSTGNTANLELQTDYEPNGVEIGDVSPGTDFTQTLTTGNITITPPTGSTNLRLVIVSIPLDSALMTADDWMNFSLIRIFPTGGATEYDESIYLVTSSFIYTRL